jgi:hypothetical protein
MMRLLKQNPLLFNDKCVGLDELPCWETSLLDWETLRVFCAAEFFNRTNPTFWSARQTDERAEVRQRGIVNAGETLRNKRGRAFPERVSASSSIDWRLQIRKARQDTSSVSLNNRHGLIEGERGDRVRGIFSDAGEFPYLPEVARKTAAVLLYHQFRCGPKVSRSCVVTQSLPGMKNAGFRRTRQGREVWKSMQPLIIIREHGGDLGLL